MTIFGRILRWIVTIFFGFTFIGFTVSLFADPYNSAEEIFLYILFGIISGGITIYSIVCLVNDVNYIWESIIDGSIFSTIWSGLVWFFSKLWIVVKAPFVWLYKLFKWLFSDRKQKKSSYSYKKDRKTKKRRERVSWRWKRESKRLAADFVKSKYGPSEEEKAKAKKIEDKKKAKEERKWLKETRKERSKYWFYDTRLYHFIYSLRVKRLEKQEAKKKEKIRQSRINRGLPPDSLTNYEKEQLEKQEKERARKREYEVSVENVEKAFKKLPLCFFHWTPWNKGRECILIQSDEKNTCRQESDRFHSMYSVYDRSLKLFTAPDSRMYAGANFFHKATIEAHMKELLKVLIPFSNVCIENGIQCNLYVTEDFAIRRETYYEKYEDIVLPSVHWRQTYIINCGYGYTLPHLKVDSIYMTYTEDIRNSHGEYIPIKAYNNMKNYRW